MLKKINSIIRIVYRIDPSTLTDDEYCEMFQDWVYYNNMNALAQSEAIKKVLVELLNEVLNNKK